MQHPLTVARIRNSLEHRISAQSFQLFENGKRVLHGLTRTKPRAALFIFGCQRSGTTHLERLFRADPRSVVFGEFSDLSIARDKTVWPPPPELRARLKAARGRFAVARSLLASHRAAEILDAVEGARAVWMFRHADEVVASMMRKWGGDFEAVSRRVETDAGNHWDLEGLWQDIHASARGMSAAEPGSAARQRDIYALYWLRRNEDYFDLGLSRDSRIRPLDYRSLLDRPDACTGALMQSVGLAPPWMAFPLTTRRISPRVRHPSFLTPRIQLLCDALYGRLCSAEKEGGR